MKQFMVKAVVVIVATVFLSPLTAVGEFYQYEDENGAVTFTDNPAKTPKRLKKKLKTRNDDMDDPSGGVTRVRISGNQVLVPVTISYRGKEVRANFLLDTGASTCTISPELASRLNIKPQDAGTALARGVGGSIYLVGHTKLDYVVVGPNRKYDMEVSIISSGNNDGLLGMNFLRELRYHVDFNANTIKWGD